MWSSGAWGISTTNTSSAKLEASTTEMLRTGKAALSALLETTGICTSSLTLTVLAQHANRSEGCTTRAFQGACRGRLLDIGWCKADQFEIVWCLVSNCPHVADQQTLEADRMYEMFSRTFVMEWVARQLTVSSESRSVLIQSPCCT
jgi:hypothetical protein